MAAVVLAFVAAFLLVMAIVGRSEGGFQLTARRYAPTLVPIAAAYFVAHYFAYLLIAGKATLAVLVDPLGRSWNPWGLGEYPLTYGWIAGAGVWWAQIALIVVGHVAAILAAHHIAVQSRPTARGALLGQSPGRAAHGRLHDGRPLGAGPAARAGVLATEAAFSTRISSTTSSAAAGARLSTISRAPRPRVTKPIVQRRTTSSLFWNPLR